MAKRLGFEAEAADIIGLPPEQVLFNQLSGCWVIADNGVDREPLLTITADDIAEMGVEGEPQEGRITLQEFKEKGVYTVASRRQLTLPGGQELLIAVGAKHGIPLLKCTLITTPHGEKFVFHVKHAPVE